MTNPCPYCPAPTGDLFGITGDAHAVEIQGVYDGTLYWECPDCGGTWHRWSPQHRLHTLAAKYIHGPTHTKEKHNG